MTRLDQHVDAVRTRFLLQKLINFGAWTVLFGACALLGVTILVKLFSIPVPPQVLLIAGAAVLALFIALILAVAYSPSREAAAVQIDQVLGLKERFSTALLSRGASDPFAQAAVKDAETLASNVSINKRFPLKMPKLGFYALGAVALFAATDRFLPQWDLLGRKESARQAQVFERKREAAEKALKEALAEVMTIPKVGAQEKNLQAARKDIEALLNQEIKDPVEATKTAQNALKEVENSRQRIEDNQRYADAQTQKEAFKALPNQQGSGLLEDAKKSLGEGKFDEAAKKLQGAVAKFEGADAATQQKMAAEMKTMADQLAKMAQDPALQERVRKDLEKQGATPEQARDMADQMAKAAAGDKNAQQRVQNMVENLARRQNGGALPAPPQLAKLMQQMKQMQSQVNAQARSGELSQAVSQLANAMQQQAAQNQQAGAQGQQQQQGQQGQKQGQQANQQQGGQKQGQQSAQGSSQTGQQNSANQKSQQGQGNQQASQQQGGQGQTDAQQAMEAAAAQLEAMQQAADAAEASRGGGKQGDGQNEGEGQGWGDAQAQGPQGQPPGQGQVQPNFSGPNAGGPGAGQRPKGTFAPHTWKKEVSPGESDDKGRVIATWLVKADSVKGESKEQLKEIVTSSQKDQAEDVEQNRVPMRAQKAVRDYFQALQDEAK